MDVETGCWRGGRLPVKRGSALRDAENLLRVRAGDLRSRRKWDVVLVGDIDESVLLIRDEWAVDEAILAGDCFGVWGLARISSDRRVGSAACTGIRGCAIRILQDIRSTGGRIEVVWFNNAIGLRRRSLAGIAFRWTVRPAMAVALGSLGGS